MLDTPSSITVPAALPSPYVHADNRGIVFCNGPRCVFIPASGLRTCAETFDLIASERRATRSQGQHVIGGYMKPDGGAVVVYAGTHDDVVSVMLDSADFGALREGLSR